MAKTWNQKLKDFKKSKLQVLQNPAGNTLLMPTSQLVKTFMCQQEDITV